MLQLDNNNKLKLAKGVVIYIPLNSPTPYQLEYCYTLNEFEEKKKIFDDLGMDYIAKEIDFGEKSWLEDKEFHSYKEVLKSYNKSEEEFNKELQLKPENTLNEILKEVANLQLKVMTLEMKELMPKVPIPDMENIETVETNEEKKENISESSVQEEPIKKEKEIETTTTDDSSHLEEPIEKP